MPDQEAISDARKRIADVLRWADEAGLVDVGIHLNDALLALDRELPPANDVA